MAVEHQADGKNGDQLIEDETEEVEEKRAT